MFSKPVCTNTRMLADVALTFLLFSLATATDTAVDATAAAAASCANGCQALVKLGFQSRLLYPGSLEYTAREASYWSVNSQLSPLCIVQPQTNTEVATVLKILANAPGNFAVRSGGHGQWAGASDIHNGVTIDLGLMTNVSYNAQTKLASVQPGPRWGDVYTVLEPLGIMVVGGRDANVGLGGYLTGGGNSYYTGRLGFGCDAVANFEVALADGSIINANKNTNADLFKVLKGGSGNFGIVTRFDLLTLPAVPLWGGIFISPRSAGDQLTSALVNFTNNNAYNPQDAYIIEYAHNTAISPDVVIANVNVDTHGVVNASAFDEFVSVPKLSDDRKVRTMLDMAATYVQPGGSRNVWFTLTVKNDARIVTKTALLHDQLVADLKAAMPADDFVSQCLFQPIPAFFAQVSTAAGGNVLGLDSVNDNALLWLGTLGVQTDAELAIGTKKMAAFSAAIKMYAKSINGLEAWEYLNYADGSQDPLKSYGTLNDILIQAAAVKYDPKGVFQNKVPGGFKISRAWI